MDEGYRQVLPLLRPRSGDLGWLGLFAAALVLAVVGGAILAYLYTMWRSRVRTHRAFHAAALERHLTKRQIRFLLDLAQQQRMRDPLLLLTSLRVFDRAAGRLAARADDDRARALLATARRRLGFDSVPPGQRFYSTRTLEPGQKLMVWPHGGQAGFLQCVVVDRDERAITAVPLLRADDRLLSQLAPGDRIKVRFWRDGDTEYRFRTRILEVEAHRTSIRMHHAETLERVQLRDFYRVRVDLPMRLLVLPAGVEKADPDTLVQVAESVVDARAMDVSGGGLSLFLHTAIPSERKVVIDPELTSPLPLAGLRAVVVAQTRQVKGWHVRLQFVDLDAAEQDDLVAALFAYELHTASP